MFNPVQICFNFLDQVLVLVYFDFRDSTKECPILVNPVHICFAFSTKFWCIPTFSTQQKMFDFVRPSSDLFQLSRPSFAFGVFRLSRLNKRVFDFFRLSSNMFRVFYQILVYSGFSTQQKMFDFVPPSSDMFRLSRPKYDKFRLSRPNKKVFEFV